MTWLKVTVSLVIHCLGTKRVICASYILYIFLRLHVTNSHADIN